jgi:polyisoprenoid-binding protein YceI
MSFHEFSGSLTLDLDNVEAASADFTVPVASLSTGFAMFDSELKGANFLDAEAFPTIRFVSTGVERTGDMTAVVSGDMTIKGATKPASFEVTVHQIGEHPVGQFFDAYKGTWMGFTATARINRSDWGVSAFIPIGSDEITIEINSEMKQGIEVFSMGG